MKSNSSALKIDGKTESSIEVSLGNATLFASRIRVVSYLSRRGISCTRSFFRAITIKCRDGISLLYE